MPVKNAYDSAVAEGPVCPELNKGKGNDPSHAFHCLLSVSSPTAERTEESGEHYTLCGGDFEAFVFSADSNLLFKALKKPR